MIRALIYAAAAIALFVLAVRLFLRLHPVFGGRTTAADRADYLARAAGYFDGSQFFYPAEWVLSGVPENRKRSKKQTAPQQALPVCQPDLASDGAVTWLGHSTVLVRMCGKTVLIDPVFSRRGSPFQWVGPKRFTEPSVGISDLPPIDAVLITHDHYDHLDMASIKALEPKTALFLVPLGVEKHVMRWVKERSKIKALAWWEHCDLGALEIVCVPANHHTGRAMVDWKQTLPCAWLLRGGDRQILESSDTGFGGHFAAIRERFGAVDLFLPDCGQYNINWHDWHMFPEEGARAAEMLHAKAVMPIHWGAFVLSDHGWDDSPERMTAACEEKGIEVVSPRLCETMPLQGCTQFRTRWWRNYE